MRSVLAFASVCVLMSGAAACSSDAAVPEAPTWAYVEPILRAECGHCHGASAAATGNGIRFDFFDMTSSACGDAAAVLEDMTLARGQAASIARAITTTDPNVRPSMPPLPAPYLTESEWLAILRWTASPQKGDKPAGNLPPRISLESSAVAADGALAVNVVVDDPEGDPVVGVVRIGDQVGRMDRSGSFSGRYDTSDWPAGPVTISAVLCDGWSQVSANLRTVTIGH
jgi:hypothetical protein